MTTMMEKLEALNKSLDAATKPAATPKKNRRTCEMCGKTKPVMAFHKNQTHCKKCHTKHVRHEKAKRVNFTKGTANTVRRRANGRCEHCGAKSNLELHHMEPTCLRPDLANSVTNLKALCPKCHKAEHAKPGMDHNTLARKANALRRRS